MGSSGNSQLSAKSVISISNLYKNFGDIKAVDGVSIDIQQGEVFGFLGPNGAGKTTTINMICGLLPPSSGSVLFSDPTLQNSTLSGHLGISPQENIFWPRLTCREQLVFMAEMYSFSRKNARKRADDLLEKLGLTAKANQQAEKLSGGMKRRLNICLALIHDPAILVLDEPEAGLDPQSRLLVREFIKSLAGKKTVIITTHNMDEADRLADRVAIIDYGKLLKLDSPRNLKRSIGDGDLLEIAVELPDSVRINEVLSAVRPLCNSVNYDSRNLIIRAPHLVGLLPELTGLLTGYGIKYREINLRENTLEDVFIHLTGRKLRA